MASIVPHINTLIIDIGSFNTRVGYAGDFQFQSIYETRTLVKKAGASPVENSIISNIENYVEIIEKLVCMHNADNVILIEHTSQPENEKYLILRKISERNICNAILFLKSGLCEVMGNGKVSGTVLNISAGSATVSVILNANIVEFNKIEKGGIFQDKILENYFDIKNEVNTIKLKEEILDNNEIDLRITQDFDYLIKEYKNLIDKMMLMRKNSNLKKNTLGGYIFFTGSVLRNKKLSSILKEHISQHYSDQISESVIMEDKLESCFAGASIFGYNNLSKALFITPADFFRFKDQIFKIKKLKSN